MDHVRHMCTSLHGQQKEQELFDQYGQDMDEYIEQTLNAQEEQGLQGLLCKSCKRYSCTIQLLQTRSADEGMTAFIVCGKCQFRRLF